MVPCNRAIFEGLERPALRIGACMPEFIGGMVGRLFQGRVLILISPRVVRQGDEYAAFGEIFRFSEV